MDKLKCIAIDDEPLALDVISSHLGNIPYVDLLETFTNPLNAQAYLQENEVDLIFLDIQMPQINGLNFARLIADIPDVIFVTAYENYALESYELNAADYLLKPVSLERLLAAVNKVYDRRKKRGESIKPSVGPIGVDQIFVRTDKRYLQLKVDDIRYIEGLKDYVAIHLADKRIVTRDSLKYISTLLQDAGFLRIHRSYLIPLKGISVIEGNMVFLDEIELPIGKSYKQDLLEKIDSNLIGDRGKA